MQLPKADRYPLLGIPDDATPAFVDVELQLRHNTKLPSTASFPQPKKPALSIHFEDPEPTAPSATALSIQPEDPEPTAERTGSPVFHTLWSYVLELNMKILIYIDVSRAVASSAEPVEHSGIL